MSLRAAIRATPTLFRIGFAEAVAYRAELLIWVLSTTMPLVSLALFSTVAREGPMGRFGAAEFTAYFLVTFIVRQLTGSWAAWQMSFEIQQGTLATRLLRPVHPIYAYAIENLAALPMRIVVSFPIATVMLLTIGAKQLPRDVVTWILWAFAMLGAWALTFLANIAIGTLSLYLESSQKVMDVYLVLFFVFSGYLVPVELFPPALRTAVDWLPFRFQIGFPVELATSAYAGDVGRAARMLARQWILVLALFSLVSLLWQRGVRRFAAFGG